MIATTHHIIMIHYHFHLRPRNQICSQENPDILKNMLINITFTTMLLPTDSPLDLIFIINCVSDIIHSLILYKYNCFT